MFVLIVLGHDIYCRTNVTPIRKCSTEEKRAAIASSLITIPDTTPVLTGLTESSSSGSCAEYLLFNYDLTRICITGSLTDSICTAYENKMTKSMNIETKSHSSDGEKEGALPVVTNLTSMLGGKNQQFLRHCVLQRLFDHTNRINCSICYYLQACFRASRLAVTKR